MGALGPRFAVCLGAVAAAGCGSGPGPEPLMQLGTGFERFVALEPGAPLAIECGPQGGQHIFISVRAKNLDGARTITSVALRRLEDGTAVCERELNGVRLLEREGWVEFSGIACFVVDPAEVSGRALELSGTITDDDDRRCAAELELTARGPPQPCS